MRVLDSFTKPPVDPSAKIGFWDKLRLIIHTRVKISFVGGGDLAMVMKGSRDPYEMSERGYGLAKVWRKDVVWLLGHDNPQGEFMQVISQDYAFGVPDLVRGGYTGHCLLPGEEEAPPPVHHLSSFNSTATSKNSESRFVKIALKLSGGIRMGLGCQLERKCECEKCDETYDAEERNAHKSEMLVFKPHYQVKFKTPAKVKEYGIEVMSIAIQVSVLLKYRNRTMMPIEDFDPIISIYPSVLSKPLQPTTSRAKTWLATRCI
jgi:hypothetical protein